MSPDRFLPDLAGNDGTGGGQPKREPAGDKPPRYGYSAFTNWPFL
jgi:hypothetical protein